MCCRRRHRYCFCLLSEVPHLVAIPTLVCWTGRHAMLCSVALVAYSVYTPLSIMLGTIIVTLCAHVWHKSYAMLCYAMLCYAMLCYAILYYAIPCYDNYAMPCYAMLCFAMAAPMLMDIPKGVQPKTLTVHNDSVQYVKPFVMTSNVIKAAMVVAVAFRPQDRTAGLIAQLVGLSLLFLITLLWFRSSIGRLMRHLSDHSVLVDGLRVTFAEPCTIPVPL
jgi:hypothetical protein